MKKHSLVYCLALVFLLAGCTAPIILDEKGIATEVVINFSTLEPTATALPTETPIIPTPMLDQLIVDACVTGTETLSKNLYQGILVLYQLDANLDRSMFLYDVSKEQVQMLSPLGWISSVVGVSPNRRHLLYEYDSNTEDEYRLAVIDYRGKVIKDFDNRYEKERWDYYNWQNNDVIRVVKTSQDQVFPRIFSPFTGVYTALSTDWTNVYKDKGLDWELDNQAIETLYYSGANIVYDPTMMRVLYPQKGQMISLTDVDTGQELASIQLPEWGRLPRWSDNGQNLVMIASTDPEGLPGHDEFFLVSRDGPEFKRLTYLTDQFEKVHISDYAWSPDGKQIAFWLNTETEDPMLEGTQSELAIVNIETGEITRLCIQGISALMTHDIQMTHIQPVWSPDGRQIAFAQLDIAKSNSYNVMIVDLDTKTAFKVASNKEPIGWMLSEP